MTELNELEIWDQFTAGDKKAFEMIYNQFHGALFNYGLRLNQDSHLVEEAIQDLFVKLWQNKHNLNRPSSLKHYLLKSLRNIIYNKLSITKRELYVGDGQDILHFEFHLPKDNSDYHQQLLKRLMEDLTERQKEAIYLFYQEELSYQEISDLLKIKIGGTYKLLYRAIDKMKISLEHQKSKGLNPSVNPKTS